MQPTESSQPLRSYCQQGIPAPCCQPAKTPLAAGACLCSRQRLPSLLDLGSRHRGGGLVPVGRQPHAALPRQLPHRVLRLLQTTQPRLRRLLAGQAQQQAGGAFRQASEVLALCGRAAGGPRRNEADSLSRVSSCLTRGRNTCVAGETSNAIIKRPPGHSATTCSTPPILSGGTRAARRSLHTFSEAARRAPGWLLS